ncbi:ATP-binding protein (plasmid) [Azospirillum oryzae]|uniref:ATP-binding protein n=1 Tax=Azospirillum oryzae TaxID=286727 RepID=A0A6N1ARN5_9PROT|nr:AAA family ATPase [Azospirillum oryzae]KAA0587058.1 ATP-binding protein [Azospirillum oryzae]QKS54079.1 ATP-binding protein [Azospirillum oryzae]GLR82262.1 hypothetical protein GCM10007856_49560 [Azospirillum oryzae]
MFRVVDSSSIASSGDEVLLIKDNWNDWFTWVTQFYAVVVAKDGSRFDIGHVKIACVGMTKENAITQLPEKFPELTDGWFSLGQSENYYETLNNLGHEYRDWFLKSLNDCAKYPVLLDRYQGEEVLYRSLLRSIDPQRVRNRFHQLAEGDSALTAFDFSFELPSDPRAIDSPPTFEFQVSPKSQPPTNVHVVIGRNGVGKSRCFDLLARSFLDLKAPNGTSAGILGSHKTASSNINQKGHGFAGLVTVSFSPFDKYGPLVKPQTQLEVRYAYVGLIQESAEEISSTSSSIANLEPLTIKTQRKLAEDFVTGIIACRTGARRERWTKALRTLEVDPLFKEANITAIADDDSEEWEDRARRLFRNLSSGHSIVLLIITKLVELVEEQSLVLIDEPEGHLHPPLLSAFIRALTDLLINRNGVAIIATHSPVVLQEVPKSCVWLLSRSGLSSRVDRPLHETFGENVGVLTHQVFGLEVVQTGFYRTIRDSIKGRSYEDVLNHFDQQLGGEARALARALTLTPRDETADDLDD